VGGELHCINKLNVRSCYRKVLVSAVNVNGQNFLDDDDPSGMRNFLAGQVSYLYIITALCGHNAELTV
jgi:hypothetical protein